MEGEQLPKATMNSFIKSKTNTPFSAEFLSKVLLVSKGTTFNTQNSSPESQIKPITSAKLTSKRPSVLTTLKLLSP